MMTKTLITTVSAMPGMSGHDHDAAMTVSTAGVDRDRDRLLSTGATLANYQRNPVVLFGHNPNMLPVGTATELSVDGAGLHAKWRWGSHDFARQVQSAWNDGLLRAASVGFLPLDFVPNEHGGRDYTKWELLEISLVPLPSNPQAVRRLKALGLLTEEGDMRPDQRRARRDAETVITRRATPSVLKSDDLDLTIEDDSPAAISASIDAARARNAQLLYAAQLPRWQAEEAYRARVHAERRLRQRLEAFGTERPISYGAF